MKLAATDRAFLRGHFPEFQLTGLTDEALDDYLDNWFASDHFDDNPVYTWNDNESTTHDLV